MPKSTFFAAAGTIGMVLLLSSFSPAMAQDGISGGDTAWILTATALVLLMTLPGLALFYGGLVNARNVLSVLMQCVAIACLMSVLWFVAGYAIAFGDGGGFNAFWGGLGNSFLSKVSTDSVSGSIPESVFVMFQMTFAIITPALIVGAFAERAKFSGVLFFSGVWLLVVYAPVCHWVWGGGWLAQLGVADFAGGLVVHATAGASALVYAIMLGKRRGFPADIRPPHNPGMVAMGAAMLWVGWFGFNAGSALAADASAGRAMLVTHLSAATASLVWMALEWYKFKKPSLVGTVTGTIAGLATITPAAGSVGPAGALVIGAAAAILCYGAVQLIRTRLKIDDSLDVFAVHGVGGILGTLLIPFLGAFGPMAPGLGEASLAGQLQVQLIGVVAVVAYSLVFSAIILVITKSIFGLRIAPAGEEEGLDTHSHGETGYALN